MSDFPIRARLSGISAFAPIGSLPSQLQFKEKQVFIRHTVGDAGRGRSTIGLNPRLPDRIEGIRFGDDDGSAAMPRWVRNAANSGLRSNAQIMAASSVSVGGARSVVSGSAMTGAAKSARHPSAQKKTPTRSWPQWGY